MRPERVNHLDRFTGLPGKQSYRHFVGCGVQQREAVLLQDFAVRLVRQPNGGLWRRATCVRRSAVMGEEQFCYRKHQMPFDF